MNQAQNSFSAGRTLFNILAYFLLFLAGEALGGLPFDLLDAAGVFSSGALYVILRMTASLLLTVLLFWLYTTRALHRTMKDFGITWQIRGWGVLVSVFLPALVAAAFLLMGSVTVNSFSAREMALLVLASVLIALKSGITEEMLFRGFIMRSLEGRWNRTVAIVVPSVLFGLVHLTAMETFTASGVVLLLVSGTLVGVMFSLVAYKGSSIGNSALLHAAWNFVMITDILHITTAQEAYGRPLVSVILPSEHALITGGAFGVEASAVAIIGYALVCCFVILSGRNGNGRSERHADQ